MTARILYWLLLDPVAFDPIPPIASSIWSCICIRAPIESGYVARHSMPATRTIGHKEGNTTPFAEGVSRIEPAGRVNDTKFDTRA